MKQAAFALQLLGLVLLPVGLVAGVSSGDTRTELVLLAVGGIIFAFGKFVLEPRAK
ncbi:MAG TPA: hypothetical protein VFF73_06600 [Planctomycetota bacterium]|nr:hypothetical protein [Planctomycetota bacterium]